MAEFTSYFKYTLTFDECGCGGLTIESVEEIEGFAANEFEDDEFWPGDLIEYIDTNGLLEVDYIGFFGLGWIGITCGCSGEEEFFLFSTDGSLLVGDEIEPVVDVFTVCFLAGTLVACPDGDRAIEDLRIGDLVLTADGAACPVRFIGRQTHATLFCGASGSRPIRIMAGALGGGLPLRDLCVSPDHALLVGGALVQAGALVNGTTIARMTGLPERFTYYHVELDDHSLIVAEGVPAETFVDNVTRRRFDNHADYVALYGDRTRSIAEMAMPRIKSARQLPRAVRRRLGEAADRREVALAA